MRQQLSKEEQQEADQLTQKLTHSNGAMKNSLEDVDMNDLVRLDELNKKARAISTFFCN